MNELGLLDWLLIISTLASFLVALFFSIYSLVIFWQIKHPLIFHAFVLFLTMSLPSLAYALSFVNALLAFTIFPQFLIVILISLGIALSSLEFVFLASTLGKRKIETYSLLFLTLLFTGWFLYSVFFASQYNIEIVKDYFLLLKYVDTIHPFYITFTVLPLYAVIKYLVSGLKEKDFVKRGRYMTISVGGLLFFLSIFLMLTLPFLDWFLIALNIFMLVGEIFLYLGYFSPIYFTLLWMK